MTRSFGDEVASRVGVTCEPGKFLIVIFEGMMVGNTTFAFPTVYFNLFYKHKIQVFTTIHRC